MSGLESMKQSARRNKEMRNFFVENNNSESARWRCIKVINDKKNNNKQTKNSSNNKKSIDVAISYRLFDCTFTDSLYASLRMIFVFVRRVFMEWGGALILFK